MMEKKELHGHSSECSLRDNAETKKHHNGQRVGRPSVLRMGCGAICNKGQGDELVQLTNILTPREFRTIESSRNVRGNHPVLECVNVE